ncbi:outer membrane protein assembly factor BamA [Aquisalinus flavus]|uniref:Outer membrane protein assembly factor BamA n=1 Tax=Aquisalinus flavus TaxID=1526572 RepID=A0A8J2V4T2_9PROT|nr:outer membrane protein assembly factor BamA [Aquisalinus flavus]GGD03985.1 outer membrane protein assembly factor BamA [Aquisalinus flavus]
MFSRLRRAVLKSVSVLPVCAALIISGQAAAQTQPVPDAPSAAVQQEQQSAFVRQVIIQGNQRIESDTVRSYLTIGAGQEVDQLSLDTALKTLFGTGLFKDVNIALVDNVLVVEVAENPIVNRIIYEGNRRTKEDKFEEEVQLAPRVIYTQAKVQSDVQRIIEVYRRSGRFAATVTPKITELPQNRVDVIFEIDEGPVTGVSKINFIGNDVYTDAELRDVVLTAESRWWNIFESNDNYDPDRLEYDRELLRKHYTQSGYADFQVVSAVAELTPDRKEFFITFQVEEGPQYEFGNIDVQTTLERVNEDLLRRTVPIRSGTTFNSELIESATEAITYSTGISGYAFVDVNPQLTRNTEARTVDVTFRVNEGPRVYIERINIGGNTNTLDRVIRREVSLVEGDAFNKILVERSERRVQGLGYFSDVEISESPGSAPDRTVLDLKVTEQSTGSFSVGAGVSSTDDFIANMSIEQRNLLGRGQLLQLDLRASARTRSVQVSFREPYFLDRNLAAGFDVYNTRLDYEEAGFVQDSLGGGLNVGFPVSESARLNLNYLLRRDNVLIESSFTGFVEDEDEAESLVVPGADITTSPSQGGFAVSGDYCDFIANQLQPTCESQGDFLTSALGYSLQFNRLDNPYRPANGWRASLSQTFAGVGGDVQYLKTQFASAHYKSLPYDFVGSLKLNVGYVDGWGGDKIRLTDRFYRGGSTFRGFEIAGIGPRQVSPQGQRNRAIGAKAFVVGTAEMLLPLPFPEEYGIRASLFTDVGTAGIVDEDDKRLNDDIANYVDYNGDGIFDEPIQDDLSLRASAGISIDWNSPFGPVRIDIAEALLREDYDETESFRFSAGGQF